MRKSCSTASRDADFHGGGRLSAAVGCGLLRMAFLSPGSAFRPGMPEMPIRNASAGRVREASMGQRGRTPAGSARAGRP